MKTIVTVMPGAEHAPAGSIIGKYESPVFYLDHAYGNVVIQFDPSTPDVTIAYLTTLVAEASRLLEDVKAREAKS